MINSLNPDQVRKIVNSLLRLAKQTTKSSVKFRSFYHPGASKSNSVSEQFYKCLHFKIYRMINNQMSDRSFLETCILETELIRSYSL